MKPTAMLHRLIPSLIIACLILPACDSHPRIKEADLDHVFKQIGRGKVGWFLDPRSTKVMKITEYSQEKYHVTVTFQAAYSNMDTDALVYKTTCTYHFNWSEDNHLWMFAGNDGCVNGYR